IRKYIEDEDYLLKALVNYLNSEVDKYSEILKTNDSIEIKRKISNYDKELSRAEIICHELVSKQFENETFKNKSDKEKKKKDIDLVFKKLKTYRHEISRRTFGGFEDLDLA